MTKLVSLLLAGAAFLAGATPAAAQLVPGPNLTTRGYPYTFAPRYGYIGPPANFSDGGYALPPPGASGGPTPMPTYGASPPFVEGAPPPPPPALGVVVTRLTSCPSPATCPVVFVSTYADGLNVRDPNTGMPIMSLVNGTPLTVLDRRGKLTMVGPACNLVPTGAWSITANVPLMRCWYD
jgi:hypothetical protein